MTGISQQDWGMKHLRHPEGNESDKEGQSFSRFLDQDGPAGISSLYMDQPAGKVMPRRDVLPSKHSKKWIMIII